MNSLGAASSGVAIGEDVRAKMGAKNMFVLRLREIYSFTQLFHRNDTEKIVTPRRLSVLGDRLFMGLGSIGMDNTWARYSSHHVTFTNGGRVPIGVAANVPYVGNLLCGGTYVQTVLPAGLHRGMLLEGSGLTAYQWNDSLRVVSESAPDGTPVEGLNLVEFEVFNPQSLPFERIKERDYEITVHLVVNFHAVPNSIIGPELRFFTRFSEPLWMKSFSGVGVQKRPEPYLVYLPDEGYSYVGVNIQDHGHGILKWYNKKGPISPVRFKGLEGSDVRLVIPAIQAYNLDTRGDDVWSYRRHATQFGFDEEHGYWCVYRFNAPYKFSGNPSRFRDTEPEWADATTPVIVYDRRRMPVISIPEQPLKEFPPAWARKVLSLAGEGD